MGGATALGLHEPSPTASKYGNNQQAIIDAASRTNPILNATAAATAISSVDAASKAQNNNAGHGACEP